MPLPPKLAFDASKAYFWQLQTSEGPIKIRLLDEVTPMHVSSTMFLTEVGFYDGLKFHKRDPGLHGAGRLPARQRLGQPRLPGPACRGAPWARTRPRTDDKHTIFGEVVEGMDAVKKLESFGSPGGKTSKPLLIDAAKIVVESGA